MCVTFKGCRLRRGTNHVIASLPETSETNGFAVGVRRRWIWSSGFLLLRLNLWRRGHRWSLLGRTVICWRTCRRGSSVFVVAANIDDGDVVFLWVTTHRHGSRYTKTEVASATLYTATGGGELEPLRSPIFFFWGVLQSSFILGCVLP